MKFCTYCGKQLADDEVCGCRNPDALSVYQAVADEKKQKEAEKAAAMQEALNTEQPVKAEEVNAQPEDSGQPVQSEEAEQQADKQDAANQPEPETASSNEEKTEEEERQAAVEQALREMANPLGFDKEKATEALNKGIGQAKSIWEQLLPLLVDPVTVSKKMADEENQEKGIKAILISLAFSAIVFLLAAKLLHLPVVKTLLIGILMMAGIYFAMAGIIYGIADVVLIGDCTFARSTTLVGCKAILDVCVLLISLACLLLSGTIGMLVFGAGSLYTMLVFVIFFAESIELDGTKKAITLWFTFIGIAACLWLFGKFGMNSVYSVLLKLL